MRYYINQQTYRLNPNGSQELRDDFTVPFEDVEGNALSTAEQRFYNQLIGDLQAEEDEGMQPSRDGTDYLYIQVWYADEACRNQVLKMSITESQIRRNTDMGIVNYMPETTEDMRGAVFIGEAIIPSEIKVVTLQRERLYCRRDGIYIKEVTTRIEDREIYWNSQKYAQTAAQAKEWCRTNLNKFAYDALFGDVAIDDDKEAMGFMVRKDHKEKMARIANRTGKSFNAILEDALTCYMDQNY